MRVSVSKLYTRTRRLAGRILRALPEPKTPFELELSRPWVCASAISTVLDVGANEGQFAGIARRLFPRANILSFEPLPRCCAALRRNFEDDPDFEAFECALGDESGTASFFENEFSPSSSLLQMKAAHTSAFPYTARTRPVQVPVRTLDDVLAGRTLRDDLFLKMDVQGYELHVLAGAPRTLPRCRLVLTEVSLEPLYDGEALARDMVNTMHTAGFRLAAVVDCLRSPNDEHPLQIDLLFARA
jgi:FkbM family methyltransferase